MDHHTIGPPANNHDCGIRLLREYYHEFCHDRHYYGHSCVNKQHCVPLNCDVGWV